MRILTLCYEYPPIGGGGGRVAQSVAEQLVARGHEVRVQTAALGWRSIRETLSGVEITRTASGRRAPDTCAVHEMGAFVATSFFSALGCIASWKPDVVHAHFAMPTGVLALALHAITRVPYVLTAHLGDVPGGVPEQTDRLFKIFGPIAAQVWKHAASATAVSSFVQQLAEQAYGRKVTRILNGIDLTNRPDLPSPITHLRPPRLVFLGRFNPQKNAPSLIDALAPLAAESWQLTMIGDGPDMPAVRERIAKHGLASRVELTGWQPAAAVQQILAEADVLCMPSSSEGMPVAAVEALKHGLAIVASDIPGVRDVVTHGANGLTAPAADVQAFTAAVARLLRERETLAAMRRASWEKARDFELTGIVDEYERVLRSAARTDSQVARAS